MLNSASNYSKSLSSVYFGRANGAVSKDSGLQFQLQNLEPLHPIVPSAETGPTDRISGRIHDEAQIQFLVAQQHQFAEARQQMPEIVQALFPLEGQRVGLTQKVGSKQLQKIKDKIEVDDTVQALLQHPQFAVAQLQLLTEMQQMYAQRLGFNSEAELNRCNVALESADPDKQYHAVLEVFTSRRQLSGLKTKAFAVMQGLPSEELKVKCILRGLNDYYGVAKSCAEAIPSIQDKTRQASLMAYTLRQSPEKKKQLIDYLQTGVLNNDPQLITLFEQWVEHDRVRNEATCEHIPLYKIAPELKKLESLNYQQESSLKEAYRNYKEYSEPNDQQLKGLFKSINLFSDPIQRDALVYVGLKHSSQDIRTEAMGLIGYLSTPEKIELAFKQLLASTDDATPRTAILGLRNMPDLDQREKLLGAIGTSINCDDLRCVDYINEMKLLTVIQRILQIKDEQARYELLKTHSKSNVLRSENVKIAIANAACSLKNTNHRNEILKNIAMKDEVQYAFNDADSADYKHQRALEFLQFESSAADDDDWYVWLKPRFSLADATSVLPHLNNDVDRQRAIEKILAFEDKDERYDRDGTYRLKNNQYKSKAAEFIGLITDPVRQKAMLESCAQSQNVWILLGAAKASQKLDDTELKDKLIEKTALTYLAPSPHYVDHSQVKLFWNQVTPLFKTLSSPEKALNIMNRYLGHKEEVIRSIGLMLYEQYFLHPPKETTETYSAWAKHHFPESLFDAKKYCLERLKPLGNKAQHIPIVLVELEAIKQYQALLHERLGQKYPNVPLDLIVFTMTRMKELRRDLGEVPLVLNEVDAWIKEANQNTAKFTQGGAKPKKPKEMQAFLENYLPAIVDAIMILGVTPVRAMYYQRENKFVHFIQSFQELRENKDPRLMPALYKIAHLPDTLNNSPPIHKAQLVELTKFYYKMNQGDGLIQSLHAMSTPGGGKQAKPPGLNIEKLRQDFIALFLNNCMDAQDLSEIPDFKFDQWDFKYIHTLPIGLQKFPQEHVTRLKSLIKSSLKGTYADYTHSGELGVVNENTQTAFTAAGLDFKKWTTYGKQTLPLQFDASGISREDTLSVVAEKVERDLNQLLEEDNRKTPSVFAPYVQQKMVAHGLRLNNGKVTLQSPVSEEALKQIITDTQLFLKQHPPTLEALQTIVSHFDQYQKEVSELPQAQADQSRPMRVGVIDKSNAPKNLFISSRTGACTSLDGINAKGAVEVLEHDFVQLLDIQTKETANSPQGETVGKVLLFWGQDPDTQKLYLVANTFEFPAGYERQKSFRHAVTKYATAYGQAVTQGKIPFTLVTGKHYNDIQTDDLKSVSVKLKVIGSALGGSYYLDSLTQGQWTDLSKTYDADMFHLAC